MADTKSGAATAADKAGSLWGEVGPAIAFVVIYNVMLRLPSGDGLFTSDTALYWATGVLMVATGAVIAMKLLRGEKVPPFLLISSAVIGVFGAVGILWQSKTFLFVKPTIVNLLYAAVIFGGLAVGRNIWKMLFKNVFDLPDFAWRTLAIRWGLFFVGMAIWNEFLWRNFSEATWANWKLGNFAIVLIFGALNTPYTLKHLQDSDEKPAAAE
ncbi:MAG: septation protein IspZ [Pseudomonadota bacterium]